MTTTDPVATRFIDASILMIARFVTELERKNPGFHEQLNTGIDQGLRMSVSVTPGHGACEVAFELVDDCGGRRRLGTITEQAPPLTPDGDAKAH